MPVKKIHTAPGIGDETKALVTRLADTGFPPDAINVYEGRNNIAKVERDGMTLNIKSFRKPSFPNNLIYTNFRKSKARRSYEHAARLLEVGIDTPTPVAYVEIKQNGLLTRSYYVSVHSPYSRTLRTWENWSADERDKVLEDYAALMAKAHSLGILHHDLSPGNILWQTNAETGKTDFHIVDLNRMSFRGRPLKTSERFSNFRNINFKKEETSRLGRIYGKITGLDEDESSARAVAALAKDRRKKERLKKIKNLFSNLKH